MICVTDYTRYCALGLADIVARNEVTPEQLAAAAG